MRSFFGFETSDLPTTRLIIGGEEPIKYQPNFGEINAENIMAYLEDYFNDKIKPHLMSEELPDYWNKYPVKILVGSNFDQVAKDPTKKVLVLFYAPWCTRSQEMIPLWDELGNKYSESTDVLIAKIDTTANELNGVDVLGFPSIKLFPAGSEIASDYFGENTVEDISEFVENGINS